MERGKKRNEWTKPQSTSSSGALFFSLSPPPPRPFIKTGETLFFILLLYYFSVSLIFPPSEESPRCRCIIRERRGALEWRVKGSYKKNFSLSLSLSHSVKNWTSSPPAPPLALSLPSVCDPTSGGGVSLYTHKTHACIHRRVNIIYIYIP